MMRKRSLSIVFVVIALVFSAWGNVMAAAFCPRFELNHDCCLKRGTQRSEQAKHESSCHHEMAGMEMDDMQMETEASSTPDTRAQNSHAQLPSESSSDEVALDLPIEQCAHCCTHSQTTSGTVSLVAIDPAKGLVENDSLPANFAVGLTPVFADLIIHSEHGPPGPASPRHIIINVFRI
jgi:uncharacterized protein involved in copper resistance